MIDFSPHHSLNILIIPLSPAKPCGDDGQRCDLVPLVGGVPSGSNPEINMTDVRDRLRDTLFCVFMSRRCITLHLGEPKCFVNEVCTACFASVVHRLCEFGAFLAQAVPKIIILTRKSISLVQVWAESRTSGEN